MAASYGHIFVCKILTAVCKKHILVPVREKGTQTSIKKDFAKVQRDVGMAVPEVRETKHRDGSVCRQDMLNEDYKSHLTPTSFFTSQYTS